MVEENNLQDEVEKDPSIEFAKNFIKDKGNSVFYYKKSRESDYRISSGSLILDDMIGLLPPCLFRLYGASGGGKTSCALSYLRNFLSTVPNSKGVYFKSEGRFSDTIKRNAGIKFVDDLEDWSLGTCYIMETNFYEGVFNFIQGLTNTPNNSQKYFFIVDSIDGLIRYDDSKKSFDEASKVAAGATLSTLAMKQFATPLNAKGHYWAVISQQRSKVSIGYVHEVNQMKLDCSGGNALTHFPDVILEFLSVDVNKQYFPSNDSSLEPARAASVRDFSSSKKDIPYGHLSRGYVKKSDTNVQNLPFEYPVRYDRAPGESIWWERETMLKLIADGWLIVGATVTPNDDFNTILEKYGIPTFSSIRGKAKAERELLESGALKLFRDLFLKEIAEKNKFDENGRHIGYTIIDELV